MRKLFLSLALTILLIAMRAGEAVASTSFITNPYVASKDVSTDCFESLTRVLTCGAQVEKKDDNTLSTADKILAAASDERVRKLRAYFEKHKSPLAPYAYDFVYYADMYGLDWKLVPAISGVESTFGKHMPKNSYNAYGWANGEYRFTSWPNSIEHVSRTLREKYYDKGADTIPKIARRYAPPSTTWGGNVQFFMTKIETFEVPSEI
jgi:hypothetical protein